MSDLLDLVDEWGPEKVVCVSDSRTGMRGVLVIDNTARGMGKGGTRMSPGVGVGEVARLARVMTWKWAGADLFLGGAKAGIRFDPQSPRKEDALRAFVRALKNEVPSEYVFGLDMGLGEADAAIVQDETGDRGAAVGTPSELGGIPYDEIGVTGFGVAEVADTASTLSGLSLSGSRVALQGFGAVGLAAASRLSELGAAIVSVSTSEGALHDPEGLDIAKLAELRSAVGDACVREYSGARPIPLGEELLVDCEIAIPAATQDVIDLDGAKRMSARIVVEAANLPTSPEAQSYLSSAGVTMVPDFIANAGGIVAAAFAMDARYSPFPVDSDRIKPYVSDRLRSNTESVLAHAEAAGLTTHEAARDLSKRRVAEAMRLKGRMQSHG